MPWLDAYSDDNKIVDGKHTVPQSMTLDFGGVPLNLTKIDTYYNYRYTGMTYDAAEVCRAAIDAPPLIVAQLQRQNDAGAYQVVVTEIVEGAWVFPSS